MFNLARVEPEFENVFKPVKVDKFKLLLDEYEQERAKIITVKKWLESESIRQGLAYFLESATTESYQPVDPVNFLELPNTLKILDAKFWHRALQLTDVLEFMPAKRRNEWFEQIRKKEIPEFTYESVGATIGDLLNRRLEFFAEMVDGVFQSLSRTHVTNQPEGFSKRMIIPYAFSVANMSTIYGFVSPKCKAASRLVVATL